MLSTKIIVQGYKEKNLTHVLRSLLNTGDENNLFLLGFIIHNDLIKNMDRKG